MKIPKSIKLSAHCIKTIWRKEIAKKGGSDEDFFLGRTDSQFNKIELLEYFDGKKLPEDVVTETYLHEIMHHISFNRDLGLTEQQVYSLSSGLFEVLRNNNLNFADRSKNR